MRESILFHCFISPWIFNVYWLFLLNVSLIRISKINFETVECTICWLQLSHSHTHTHILVGYQCTSVHWFYSCKIVSLHTGKAWHNNNLDTVISRIFLCCFLGMFSVSTHSGFWYKTLKSQKILNGENSPRTDWWCSKLLLVFRPILITTVSALPLQRKPEQK